MAMMAAIPLTLSALVSCLVQCYPPTNTWRDNIPSTFVWMLLKSLALWLNFHLTKLWGGAVLHYSSKRVWLQDVSCFLVLSEFRLDAFRASSALCKFIVHCVAPSAKTRRDNFIIWQRCHVSVQGESEHLDKCLCIQIWVQFLWGVSLIQFLSVI